MIIESIFNLLFGVVDLLLSGVSVFNLNFGSISLINQILSFFGYVVGSDITLMLFSSVTFWLSVKFSLGVLIYVYRLIPFI